MCSETNRGALGLCLGSFYGAAIIVAAIAAMVAMAAMAAIAVYAMAANRKAKMRIR